MESENLMERFYEKILKWKNNKPFSNNITSNGSELICNVRENIKNDYLHILFYPLKKKFVKKEIHSMVDNTKSTILEEYIKFLSMHNGMLLYCGAISIFGVTKCNSINEFIEPFSVKTANKNDFYNKSDGYLYVGNILYYDYTNVNIYLDLKREKVLLISKNNLIKDFLSLNEFLNHIIEFYDSKYDEKGMNLNYNDKRKYVYENTQLYY